MPSRSQSLAQDRGQPVHAACDRRQSFRPVIDGVHARHHRKEHLRRADVRRRLLAADVLLARLQREAICGHALRVDRDADEAPRQRALVLVARREVAGVRTAVAHRHAEALRRADDGVGAPLAGRLQQRQREEIGGDHDVAARSVDGRHHRRVIAHVTVHGRVLQQHAEDVRRRRGTCRTDDDLDVERRRARAHDVERLRQHFVGDEKARARRRAHPLAERHRLRGRRRFVEHRRVRDRHAGQVAHHRLEVDERFEPALRNLRLIRRVRRVPRGILEDVALDDARRVRAVVALPDERLRDHVATMRSRAAQQALPPRTSDPGSGSASRSRIAAGTSASISAARVG